MESIGISITNKLTERNERFRNYINAGLMQLQEEHISCEMVEMEDEHHTSYHFTFKHDREGMLDLVNHYLSDSIAEYIVEVEEDLLLNSIISKDFFYGQSEELSQILKYANHLLDYGDFETEEKSDLRKLGRKCRIFSKVYDYLNEQRLLQLDGFIRFRLQDYYEELREVVEYSIDEYVMDKEYQEFIKLLRYFVIAQQPKVDLVHVMHYGDRNFVICDEKFKPYKAEDVEGFMKGMAEQELNYADYIVSTLISVAPREILLHTREGDTNHVIRTMKNIFEERLELCAFCDQCEDSISQNRLDKGNSNLYHS